MISILANVLQILVSFLMSQQWLRRNFLSWKKLVKMLEWVSNKNTRSKNKRWNIVWRLLPLLFFVLNLPRNGATALVVMTLCIITLGIMTLGIMTLSFRTRKMSPSTTQGADYFYAEWCSCSLPRFVKLCWMLSCWQSWHLWNSLRRFWSHKHNEVLGNHFSFQKKFKNRVIQHFLSR